jgi:sigma-B regulation protein RsbU (phosphoserine phosphatase)
MQLMSSLSDMRVMIVDDTEANIDILIETLGEDYRVVVATDGEMALEDIRRNPPDLILLDIMMPGIDGYEVCRRLRKKEPALNIPVIFLTALKEEGDEAKGLALGAVDYITKPFNPGLVKSRVRNHLELKRYRNHLEDLVEARTREIAERQRTEYELRAAKEKIEHELTVAAQIQNCFLPPAFPAFPERREFDLFAMMRPARRVGGDFYDFFLLGADQLVLIVADVSDKSIPAALYMMVSRTIFRSLARQIRSPAEVLSEANDLIYEENGTCMFVTALMAVYTISTGRLVLANAGHTPPIRIEPDGTPRSIEARHGMALGIQPGLSFDETEGRLALGQALFLYTDGVTEALSPTGDLFGVKGLIQGLDDCRGLDLAATLNHVVGEVVKFQEGEQVDDVTMLALKRTA